MFALTKKETDESLVKLGNPAETHVLLWYAKQAVTLATCTSHALHQCNVQKDTTKFELATITHAALSMIASQLNNVHQTFWKLANHNHHHNAKLAKSVFPSTMEPTIAALGTNAHVINQHAHTTENQFANMVKSLKQSTLVPAVK
jgi:hypothetical protein